jgi:hypothetical protein
MMRLTYSLAIEKIKDNFLGKALLAAQSNDKTGQFAVVGTHG